MADTMIKLREIAYVSFQETMRRKVFYLILFLTVLLGGMFAAQSVTITMASDAGEKAIVSEAHNAEIATIFNIWSVTVTMLSLYLGAIAVSSEATAKTLVNVLSRPVGRATYLTGRWFGLLAVVFAFQAIGLIAAVATAHHYGAQHTPELWIGCAEAFVSAFAFSGLSIALSVMMPPMLAGGLAFMVFAVPSTVSDWLQSPHFWARALSNAGYFLAPAQMPVDLIQESFSKGMVHPTYGLYLRVLAENGLYALVVFVAGCMVFARREVRLR